VRIFAVLLSIVSVAACNRAKQGSNNNDAVRQGVVEYLQSKGFDIPKAMTVTVTKVDPAGGDQADATVSISPTGGDPKQGMTMRYRLEQKAGKWAVTGRSESGGQPHEGAGAMPKAPSGPEPHGGGAAPAGGSSKMPSPDDLPPAKK
jgi:hypothetical protein